MELRTYVGRRISYSVLFSATDQNPLESTQGTARTILEALGCSDLIGKTDEASCTRLYEALIGSMGINLSSIAPKPGVIDGKDLHIYRHKIKTAVKESTIPKKAIA